MYTHSPITADPSRRDFRFGDDAHESVLPHMVQACGIELETEPPYLRLRDQQWAFMVTGFSKCIDSFFGFGLFKIARSSGVFPLELADTFERVMREEGRVEIRA